MTSPVRQGYNGVPSREIEKVIIINLRGTSGSGKSTVVRRVAKMYDGGSDSYFEPPRIRPLHYVFKRKDGGRPLWVLGHYATACGGCDTIKSPDEVYALVGDAVASGADVIYEGIIVQDDTRRLLELNARHPVSVVELTTPIEECLLGIQNRRDARKDARPLNPKNTTDRFRRVHNTCEKLRREHGVSVYPGNREEAYHYCLGLLGFECRGCWGQHLAAENVPCHKCGGPTRLGCDKGTPYYWCEACSLGSADPKLIEALKARQ